MGCTTSGVCEAMQQSLAKESLKLDDKCRICNYKVGFHKVEKACDATQQTLAMKYSLKIDESCPCCSRPVGYHKDLVAGEFQFPENDLTYNFERRHLASYHPPLIIGNHSDIVKEVEELLLKPGNNSAKEDIPVVCIVNPPRHGKSLLLDRIFYDRSDVRVVEITYNNNSNVTEEETRSPQRALYHFWLRFIGSVCGHSFVSLISSVPFEDNLTYTLAWAKKILLKNYHRNPFIDAGSKTQLRLVIAVDEFSKLTDELARWHIEDKKAFIRSLCNERQESVQFVFTGFNTEMNACMEESGVQVIFKTLSLCDFSSAKPLLKLIIDAYPEGVKIPMLLFETVKSTPGLVGLWAERVLHHKCLDLTLSNFVYSLTWIDRVTKIKPDYGTEVPPVAYNWYLIVEYLQGLEADNSSDERTNDNMLILGKQLVLNTIGVLQKAVGSDGTETMQPVLSPLCFVCIARSKYEPKNEIERDLKVAINSAIDQCERRPEWNEGSSNDGKPFENFVVSALKTRIITRRLSDASSASASFRFIDLFPADVSRMLCNTSIGPFSLDNEDRSFNSFVSPCHIHGISSKEKLSKMMTAPLYYLFPLGLEILNADTSKVDNNRSGGVIVPLVESSSTTNSGDFKFQIKVSPKWCKNKITFINNATINNFSTEEERIISNSSTQPGNEYREEVRKVWHSMQVQIDIILRNKDCSVFELSERAAGCDLVLLCKESDSKYHIVALEIKDSRATRMEVWLDKLRKLTSFRCIVPRLRSELQKENIDLSYHIVFAGRDGS